MKISKIPGLGRFGVFIDDLDFNNITDEEWMEIGKLHLESLVTIIRNVNVAPKEYQRRIEQWGEPIGLAKYRIYKKYKTTKIIQLLTDTEINGVPVDEEDREWLKTTMKIFLKDDDQFTKIIKVTGTRDESGKPTGMFSQGELLWHANESGNLCFSPGVSLLGVAGMVGSSTSFVTTTDWYEKQSESFRSELDEMMILHSYSPGKISPGLPSDEDRISYKSFCPVDNVLPLVINSPGGIKGLHYTVNTTKSIVGMSQEESDKLFKHIDDTLFTDEYVYNHWYAQDNDLCLFDNSITLHKRLGGVTERMAYRIQFDYGRIRPADYNPYFQEPFKSQYREELQDLHASLGMYQNK